MFTKAVHEIAIPELGVEVFLNWAAQAGPNCVVGLYNDTSQPDGGWPTPFYDVFGRINSKQRQPYASAFET